MRRLAALWLGTFVVSSAVSCSGDDESESPRASGSGGDVSDTSEEQLTERSFLEVPLLSNEARQEITKDESYFMKQALFQPFPHQEVIADYYIRRYVLEKASDEEVALWAGIRRSAKPLRFAVADHVEQHYPDLAKVAKFEKVTSLMPRAAELDVLREFIIQFESVSLSPEVFEEYKLDKKGKHLQLYREALKELDDGKRSPSELTLRAIVRSLNQLDLEAGVAPDFVADQDSDDDWEWVRLISVNDARLRHFLTQVNLEEDDADSVYRLASGTELGIRETDDYVLYRNQRLILEVPAALQLVAGEIKLPGSNVARFYSPKEELLTNPVDKCWAAC